MTSRTRTAAALGALVLGLVGGVAPAAQTGASAPPVKPPAPVSDAPKTQGDAPAPMTAPEFRLGNPAAKVVVVEYASDTCPHCARFAADVFPEFRRKWVDTGKVLFIFREFPTDPVPLSTAGFVVARCAGAAHYLDVVDALFKAQTTSSTGLDFLLAGAKAGGLDEAAVRACLNDQAAVTAVQERAAHAADTDKITGTPTLVVNGKPMDSGAKTLAQLDAVITPLLAGAPTRRR